MNTLFERLRSLITVENSVFLVGLCLVLGVSLGTGIFLKEKFASEQTEYVLTSHTEESFLPTEHYLRRGDGPYTFIEYIDLDCPHCKKIFVAQEAYLREQNPNATFIVRHFPLIEWHPGARDKAVTSECVAESGGDEAFFTLLSDYFNNEDISMSTTSFRVFAETYVTDKDQYALCHTTESARDRLRDHIKQGLYAGVFSTPTIVVLKDDVFLARHDLLTDTTGIRVIEHYLNTEK